MWWLAEIASRVLWRSEHRGVAFAGAMLAQVVTVVGVLVWIGRWRSRSGDKGLE